MSWRAPTSDDLIATLSQREADIFRRSAAELGADPVPAILRATADLVRAYCRSHGNIRMSPDAAAIPQSLMAPAMDYAAYDLLKRFPTRIAESREKARSDALSIFRDVAAGRLNPESHDAAPDTPSGKVAVQIAATSRRRVTAAKLEGL